MAAMVFGFIASANSWDPLQRIIEVMTSVYFARLMGKTSTEYKKYMDMITIEEPPRKGSVEFTPAFPCGINKGVLDEKGNRKTITPRIYVYDAICIAVWMHMRNLLITLLKAIFLIGGNRRSASGNVHLLWTNGRA